MSAPEIETSPYWSATAPFHHFPKLNENAHADVVVVGAGITGLMSAYLLAESGKSVIVIDRGRCAMGDTGHTSAHLTMITDQPLKDLVKIFGRDHAQAVWDAGLAAIAQIDEIVRAEKADADFKWVDGYLHLPKGEHTEKDAAEMKEEAEVATELGFDAEYVDDVPVLGGPGIRYEGQARIHPRKFLAAVAMAIVAKGGRIYEETNASEFHADPLSITANGHTLTCSDIVIATNNPLVGVSGMASAALLQTKLALYSSYVVAGRVPKGTLPDVMWWDNTVAYAYLRIEQHRDFDVVIYGGEDHKTGQADDTEACYTKVEKRVKEIVPGIELTHRWSGQVVETPDGLPYIGATADHQYSATGYCGNGITFGTIAAMIIADALTGRKNPWADLFDPSRKALGRSTWEYIKENADYPYYMIRDQFAGAEGKSLRSVRRGHGKIIQHNGAKVAAYRDDAGVVTMKSAKCTHMGCVVTWNGAESTWDCPCHGSRFKTSGEVIAGPAETPLADVE